MITTQFYLSFFNSVNIIFPFFSSKSRPFSYSPLVDDKIYIYIKEMSLWSYMIMLWSLLLSVYYKKGILQVLKIKYSLYFLVLKNFWISERDVMVSDLRGCDIQFRM